MIPGGRIQDRYGPKVGATLGGLFLAAGCILAGLMKSYLGWSSASACSAASAWAWATRRRRPRR